MVHALEKIQRLLKPEGLLVDIHPSVEPASITVRLNNQSIPAGWVNEKDDYVEYEWADAALQQVTADGLFTLERSGAFEFIWHGDSIADLRAYMVAEWKDAIIDDMTALRVEDLLATAEHDKEVIVREPIRIARFRRR